MILYFNLTNSERLLLSLELFLIFPSSMSSHNQTCWRDLKRNQCYLLCRLPFGLLYYSVEYPFVLLYDGISMWLMIFLDGIVFQASEFGILPYIPHHQCLRITELVGEISSGTNAIYGAGYLLAYCTILWNILLFYYTMEYLCGG